MKRKTNQNRSRNDKENRIRRTGHLKSYCNHISFIPQTQKNIKNQKARDEKYKV